MWDLRNGDGLSDGRIQLFSSNGLISSTVKLAVLTACLLFNLPSMDLFLPMLLAHGKSRFKERWLAGKKETKGLSIML
jgi:hypothetical protein